MLKVIAMWTKIFLILFVVALLALSWLTILSYLQLQSVGFAPRDIAAGFLGYRDIFWFWLPASTLVLLIVSNVIIWISRQAWALWLTYLFFAAFTLLQTWWLGELYGRYVEENSLADGGYFSGIGILSVLICIAAAVAVYFDQFLVLRMRDRVHGDGKPSENVAAVEKDSTEQADSTKDEV